METAFFLASNSARGFYSLYDDFPGDNAYLHIIKAGPGMGKSGFMRRIAAAAKERGLDTELIYCSGDPDSLDGLHIPALKQAWMDGTAPHVREAKIFGVDSDYVNLGAFCHVPLSAESAEKAEDINRRYKELYTRAYGYLKAAAAAETKERERGQDENIINQLFENVRSNKTKSEGKQRRRFISAISCKGIVRLEETVHKLCKQNYLVDPSEAHRLLSSAAKRAEDMGLETILCPEPLRPERLEAVILPEQGIYIGINPDEKRVNSTEEMFREKAIDCLRSAKELHDDLEAVYKSQMDFSALTEYTDRYIEKLFG